MFEPKLSVKEGESLLNIIRDHTKLIARLMQRVSTLEAKQTSHESVVAWLRENTNEFGAAERIESRFNAAKH
jgi:hypothetical protein